MKSIAPAAAFVISLLSLTAAASAQIVALQQKTTIQPSLALTYAIDKDAFVHVFAGSYAPQGFGAANGQLVSIGDNFDLFTRIGTTYGGDGVTNFGLPNLNGRVAVGSGAGPGLTNTNVGDMNGSESVFLNSNQYPPGVGGLAQPFNNLQPGLTLNYLIADQGIYPVPPEPGFSSTGLPFLGEIALYAGTIAPTGWHFADGNLLAISTNTALFSLLGTTYGGDGVTNFALPDLRGRTPIGAGSGAGLTPQFLGEVSGTETTTLNNGNIPSLLGGAGLPYSNMQPTLGINFMMSPFGIYPSPDTGPINFSTQTDPFPFFGEVFMFGGNFIPAGFRPTDGSTLAINTNTALFSLLLTNYGGNGITTFALPDLRGRVILGDGSFGAGLSPYTAGNQVGVESLFLDANSPPVEPPVTAVPEPATFVYVALGGLALIARRAFTAKKRRE